nr:oxysterol-binding protein homolog 1-like [Ipomoea batatas]
MATSSSSFESSAHSAPIIDQLVLEELSTNAKTGSTLDRDGYLRHSEDKAMTECVLKCLEDAGLMTFVMFNYKIVHNLDATEFYVNARLSSKEDAIHSTVNGTEVTIVHGDIRVFFKFLV